MSLYCCCKACYSCGISSACRMSWFTWMSSSCQQMEQRCRGQRGCSCKHLVRAQVLAMLINYWHKASNQTFWEIKLGAGCWDGKELKESYASLLSSCSRAKSVWSNGHWVKFCWLHIAFTYLLIKKINWTLIQEMSILLGCFYVDKAHICYVKTQLCSYCQILIWTGKIKMKSNLHPFLGAQSTQPDLGCASPSLGSVKTQHLFWTTILGSLHTKWSSAVLLGWILSSWSSCAWDRMGWVSSGGPG